MKTRIVLLMMIPLVSFGQGRNNVESTLEVLNIQTGEREVIHKDTIHFEAPNWSRDGTYFILNSRGKLFKLVRGEDRWEEIDTDFAQRCNNDHGISPDGKQLVISHYTEVAGGAAGSAIYILPVTGGVPVKVTGKVPSYWHGWSPDGKTLVYVGRREGEYDIYSISVDGGDETRLTRCPGLDDGPEYSADGKYIYYNSFCSGRMEIWKMEADGSNPAQLTDDPCSNWFPHPSPDGRYLVYLSYITDQQQGHPFGKDVKLRLMDLENGKIKDLTEVFFGGQGTINVPSWSPDSREVAFVSYRLLE
ncbi:MAG: TolB family protein [Bacteroidales bacterium]|nr:MAG: TolB family protein [Bacteroidales bacterium]